MKFISNNIIEMPGKLIKGNTGYFKEKFNGNPDKEVNSDDERQMQQENSDQISDTHTYDAEKLSQNLKQFHALGSDENLSLGMEATQECCEQEAQGINCDKRSQQKSKKLIKEGRSTIESEMNKKKTASSTEFKWGAMLGNKKNYIEETFNNTNKVNAGLAQNNIPKAASYSMKSAASEIFEDFQKSSVPGYGTPKDSIPGNCKNMGNNQGNFTMTKDIAGSSISLDDEDDVDGDAEGQEATGNRTGQPLLRSTSMNLNECSSQADRKNCGIPHPHPLRKDDSSRHPQSDEDFRPLETESQGLGKRSESEFLESLGDSLEQTDSFCTKIAIDNSGKYIKRKVRYENEYRFKCEIGHTVILKKDQLGKVWCSQCASLWEDTLVYLKRHKIKVLSKKIKPVIQGKCQRGHVFEFPIKKAKKTFCPDCKKSKNDVKQNFNNNYDEMKFKQNQTLEDTKQTLLRASSSESSTTRVPDNSDVLSIFDTRSMRSLPNLANLAVLNEEIEKMAQVYASEYKEAHAQQQRLERQPSKDIDLSDDSFDFSGPTVDSFDFFGPTEEQTLWIYKLMIMPNDMLTRLLSHNNNLTTQKQIFRRLSIQVHPDKNSHPMSTNAFQKLFEVYEDLSRRLQDQLIKEKEFKISSVFVGNNKTVASRREKEESIV